MSSPVRPGVLVLLRHGQTEANLEGRIDTRLPGAPLTTAGRAQATAVASELTAPGSALLRATGGPVDALYSSVATRAVETAAVLGARLAVTPTQLEGVQEIDGGEFDGRSDPEARQGYLRIYARWQRGDLEFAQPGGESGRQALDRLLPAVRTLIERHPGQVVLLVAHAAAIELLSTTLCAGLDGEFAVAHPLPSCAAVVLVGRADRWQCVRWGDIPSPAGFDPVEYELNWPPEIFVAEASDMLRNGDGAEAWERLLAEAFTGDRPASDYRRLTGASADAFLTRLVEGTPDLPQAPKLRVDGPDDDSGRPDHQLLAVLTGELYAKLHRYGYLSSPAPAPDARRPAEVLRMIETVHALVARPRTATEFSPGTGRALYRAHVNRNLRRAGVAFWLTTTPSGLGRLVAMDEGVEQAAVERVSARGSSGRR